MRAPRSRLYLLFVVGALGSAALFGTSPAAAATLPTGFAETQVATGLASPTAMAFAPDGRLFVAEQGGRLRVIKNGALLRDAVRHAQRRLGGERGLLGVAFDPDFATNRFVYVYYTTATLADPQPRQPLHRERRRGGAGQRGRAPRPREPLERDQPQRRRLHFGPDGKLYVAVGDNANGANSQTRQPPRQDAAHQPRRHDPDRQPVLQHGHRREPRDLGLGLRNPFTFAFQPGRPDVHQRRRPEHVGGDQRRRRRRELRLARHRGPDDRPALPRAALRLRARQLGDDRLRDHRRRLLQPGDAAVPRRVRRRLLLRRLLRRLDPPLDPANERRRPLRHRRRRARSTSTCTRRQLYYLDARLRRLRRSASTYTASQAPSHHHAAASQTVPVGRPATFTVAASGTPPLTYQWQRNGVDIAGATAPLHLPPRRAADNGARFRASSPTRPAPPPATRRR